MTQPSTRPSAKAAKAAFDFHAAADHLAAASSDPSLSWDDLLELRNAFQVHKREQHDAAFALAQQVEHQAAVAARTRRGSPVQPSTPPVEQPSKAPRLTMQPGTPPVEQPSKASTTEPTTAPTTTPTSTEL